MGSAGGQRAPLHMSVTIPDGLLIPVKDLRIGWLDESVGVWSEEGLDSVKYDMATRVLRVTSASSGSIALLTDRTDHFPYRGWSWEPKGVNRGSLLIRTPIGMNAIDVDDGLCRLRMPMTPQLKHLEQGLPVLLFMKALADAGIFLAPGNVDDLKVLLDDEMTSPLRPEAFSQRLAMEMAHVAPAFHMRWSRWSSSRSLDRVLLRAAADRVYWHAIWRRGKQCAKGRDKAICDHLVSVRCCVQDEWERNRWCVFRRCGPGIPHSSRFVFMFHRHERCSR